MRGLEIPLDDSRPSNKSVLSCIQAHHSQEQPYGKQDLGYHTQLAIANGTGSSLPIFCAHNCCRRIFVWYELVFHPFHLREKLFKLSLRLNCLLCRIRASQTINHIKQLVNGFNSKNILKSKINGNLFDRHVCRGGRGTHIKRDWLLDCLTMAH